MVAVQYISLHSIMQCPMFVSHFLPASVFMNTVLGQSVGEWHPLPAIIQATHMEVTLGFFSSPFSICTATALIGPYHLPSLL